MVRLRDDIAREVDNFPRGNSHGSDVETRGGYDHVIHIIGPRSL
jgi:hypothetical protein